MNLMSFNDLISQLNLCPHPEGGYFRETYRSNDMISKESLPGRFKGERTISTAIYYLLGNKDISKFHKILSDEIWHFYLGGPLELLEIDQKGELSTIKLGSNLLKGECLQYTVKQGQWFAARPLVDSAYCLLGCTVAPGFDFADFEMGSLDKLTSMFPKISKDIFESLT